MAHARGETAVLGHGDRPCRFQRGRVPHGPRDAQRGLLCPREATVEHRHGRIDPTRPWPRAWLKQVKDPAADPQEEVQIGGKTFRVGELRERLLVTTSGESIAYLTDFRLDAASEDRLVAMLAGCTTIVCENNFRDAERESAERTFHMVSAEVARLAARSAAEARSVSPVRPLYPAEWLEQLERGSGMFPETYFPPSWAMANSVEGDGH